MVRFKKRGAREIVWGPDEPWVEPKKEVVLGPAGTPSDMNLASSSSSGESALGFLGEMAGAAEPSSSLSDSGERPTKSPYGYNPTESSSNPNSSYGYSDSSSSSNSSLSSNHVERIERLHRKLNKTIERLEEIEKKINRVQDKLDLRDY